MINVDVDFVWEHSVHVCLSKFTFSWVILGYYKKFLFKVIMNIKHKIKFWIKFQDNSTEIFNKLAQNYGNQVLFQSQVFKYHKVFLDGLEDEHCSSQPVTSWTEENKTKMILIRSDKNSTVKNIDDELTLISWFLIRVANLKSQKISLTSR